MPELLPTLETGNGFTYGQIIRQEGKIPMASQFDWNTAWKKLDPSDFEELVFCLLHREGFFDIHWYGASGQDKGRDIVCRRTEIFGLQIAPSLCVVQCKRYSGAIPRQRLQEDILKAMEHRPEYFILATTGTINASAKDWLKSQQDRSGFRIVLWEKTHLQVLLERHQDLRAQYLGADVDRDYFLRQLARAAGPLLNLDAVLGTNLNPGVRQALTTACELALKYSSIVTIGHVLVGLLRRDTDCTRRVFQGLDIDPSVLADDLERAWVSRQMRFPTRQLGMTVSTSLRLAFEAALKMMLREGVGTLREDMLLESMLSQRRSATVRSLPSVTGLTADDVLEAVERSFGSHLDDLMLMADISSDLSLPFDDAADESFDSVCSVSAADSQQQLEPSRITARRIDRRKLFGWSLGLGLLFTVAMSLFIHWHNGFVEEVRPIHLLLQGGIGLVGFAVVMTVAYLKATRAAARKSHGEIIPPDRPDG